MHLPSIMFYEGVQILQQYSIKEYIQTVCEQIRWEKAHASISKEIEDHIVDQKTAFLNSGLDDKTATEKAIMEMGDPVLIGTELDRTYRPKIEWSIIALTFIMVLTGFLVRYFMIYNAVEPIKLSLSNDILGIIIGFIFMLTAYFFDFSSIGKYPKQIFLGMTALLFISILMSNQSHYSHKFLLLPINFSFVFLLLPTAFAGIIYDMRNKGYLGIIQAGLFYFASAIICLNAWNISSVVIYSVSCLLLLTIAILNGWFNVKKINALLIIYGAVTLISLILIYIIISTKSYIFYRIQAASNPMLEPQTSGWLIIFVREIVTGAKLFGQGSLGKYGEISIPNKHSDLLLTYLIHNLGWLFFAVIMTIIIIFIIRLFILCKKQKSILAKLVSTSVLITFIMQFIVYVAYNLGFQLLSPLSLPFISYGGTSTVINMVLIGIMLSVFNTGELYRDDISKYSPNKNKLFEYKDGKNII